MLDHLRLLSSLKMRGGVSESFIRMPCKVKTHGRLCTRKLGRARTPITFDFELNRFVVVVFLDLEAKVSQLKKERCL